MMRSARSTRSPVAEAVVFRTGTRIKRTTLPSPDLAPDTIANPFLKMGGKSATGLSR